MLSTSIPAAGIDEIFRPSMEGRAQVFIFNDIVDLLAFYGMIRLGRVVWNRRHKVGH
jgi:hypothetical protein